MGKIQRNGKCPCGSGKKYKKCCLEKDYTAHAEEREAFRQRIIYGDEYSSVLIEETAQELKEKYPDHEVIDVTGVLESTTYNVLQEQHYSKKVIMLAERDDNNEAVFAKRCPEGVDMMVMYRGAYQCFVGGADLEESNIFEMIETRLRDNVWEGERTVWEYDEDEDDY